VLLVEEFHQRDRGAAAGTDQSFVVGRFETPVLAKVGDDLFAQRVDGGAIEPEVSRGVYELLGANQMREQIPQGIAYESEPLLPILR
jgi:hypothetical protein